MDRLRATFSLVDNAQSQERYTKRAEDVIAAILEQSPSIIGHNNWSPFTLGKIWRKDLSLGAYKNPVRAQIEAR